LALGCSHASEQASGFQLSFAVEPKPSLLLISPSWSDRGLAMLDALRLAKKGHPELQLVLVLLDDLPVNEWGVVAKALNFPGIVRRPHGLGLEAGPLGPVREVPLLFWIGADERIYQRAYGFITQQRFADETRRFMETQ
jgi:hypothetical protein